MSNLETWLRTQLQNGVSEYDLQVQLDDREDVKIVIVPDGNDSEARTFTVVEDDLLEAR